MKCVSSNRVYYYAVVGENKIVKSNASDLYGKYYGKYTEFRCCYIFNLHNDNMSLIHNVHYVNYNDGAIFTFVGTSYFPDIFQKHNFKLNATEHTFGTLMLTNNLYFRGR